MSVLESDLKMFCHCVTLHFGDALMLLSFWQIFVNLLLLHFLVQSMLGRAVLSDVHWLHSCMFSWEILLKMPEENQL